MEKTVIDSENEKDNKIFRTIPCTYIYEMLGYSKDDENIFLDAGIEHIKMSKVV